MIQLNFLNMVQKILFQKDKTFDFSNKCLNDLLINMENELDHNVIRKTQ